MKRRGGYSSHWYEDGGAVYQVCPIKLARENSYDTDKTISAINRYEYRGAGRFQSREENEKTREMALLTCRQHEAKPRSIPYRVPEQPGRTCPTTIISIDGWDNLQREEEDKTDTDERVPDFNDKGDKIICQKRIGKAIVTTSLAVLIMVLLYISQKITVRPTPTSGIVICIDQVKKSLIHG
jgi:hypothetical protein